MDHDDHDYEREKRSAAVTAAALVEDGMTVGLGTGSTVAYLLPALGRRRLDISCVATSPATESLARAEGLRVLPFEGIGRLDLAIDGADQVDPHAADRFAVIVSSNKVVPRLHPPVPLELMAFGVDALLTSLPGVVLRGAPRSPDGGLLADYHGAVEDPEQLSARFCATPGVVAHGLFPPTMVTLVLVGDGGRVETLERRPDG